MERAEIVVVGGGPAGTAAAIFLARSGREVVLVDKTRFPRPKFCGEFLGPGAVAILDELGLRGEAEAQPSVRSRGIRLGFPGGILLEALYPPGENAGCGLSIRRDRLDAVLLGAARREGVRIFEGWRCTELLRDSRGAVSGVAAEEVGTGASGERREIGARVVLGADGRNSVVAARLGLRRPARFLRRFALGAHVEGLGGLDDLCEMHLFEGGVVGVADSGDGTANVVYVFSGEAARRALAAPGEEFERRIRTTPPLALRAGGAVVAPPVRVLGPLAYTSSRVAGPGFLLLGDAASFFDPITGEGIHRAFRSALLAHETVENHLRNGTSLEAYERPFRRESAARDRFDALVQIALLHPLLGEAAGRILRRFPSVARALVAHVGGCGSPRGAGSGSGAPVRVRTAG